MRSQTTSQNTRKNTSLEKSIPSTETLPKNRRCCRHRRRDRRYSDRILPFAQRIRYGIGGVMLAPEGASALPIWLQGK